jgi:hypothetical protein
MHAGDSCGGMLSEREGLSSVSPSALSLAHQKGDGAIQASSLYVWVGSKDSADPAKVFAVSVARPDFTPPHLGPVDGSQKSQQLSGKH